MDNNIKTTLLLGGLTGLFMLIGSLLGGTSGMVIAFLFAVIMNMGAWYFSDSLALRMNGAREVSPQQAPELHEMVERLARSAGIPKPKVYIVETPMPNAFATGRDPQHGAVAATTGIMQMLTYGELEGVMAHEIAHIKNRDTLISSISATFAGAISMLADMAMWSALFGGFSNRDEEGGGGAGQMIVGLLVAIVAPLAAVIIQMAISRSREYGADRLGAEICGKPQALASALAKIEAWGRGHQQAMAQAHVNPGTSHMYIINPLIGGGLANLFRTHPPTEERIARLQAMARGR
jgi:heat shock protein HtpX